MRCTVDIPSGTFICSYEGELISSREAVSAAIGHWPGWGTPGGACRLSHPCNPAHCVDAGQQAGPAEGVPPDAFIVQEERRGADFYLFDLDHFVIMVRGDKKPRQTRCKLALPGCDARFWGTRSRLG